MSLELYNIFFYQDVGTTILFIIKSKFRFIYIPGFKALSQMSWH
jgi:hypothetical protein